MSSKFQRSSISPFRSSKAPTLLAPKPGARPTTPSSSSSSARPTTPSSSSARATTPSSSSARPTSPSSSSARPRTPSYSSSSAEARPPPQPSKLSPVSPVSPSSVQPADFIESKENVTVTVRFRGRGINKGDEIAWYADGGYTVRNKYNSAIAYGFGGRSQWLRCQSS